MSHPHAPHNVTLVLRIGTHEQRAVGDFVSIEPEQQYLFSLPCRNLQEAQRAKKELVEVIQQCLKQKRLEMSPTKQ